MEEALHVEVTCVFIVTNGIRVFRRQRVENAESYYDAGALLVCLAPLWSTQKRTIPPFAFNHVAIGMVNSMVNHTALQFDRGGS